LRISYGCSESTFTFIHDLSFFFSFRFTTVLDAILTLHKYIRISTRTRASSSFLSLGVETLVIVIVASRSMAQGCWLAIWTYLKYKVQITDHLRDSVVNLSSPQMA
jgi:hypothetical protein